MDINTQITYRFPYKWAIDGMPGHPIVNPLMKAIIEDNITEMYSLVKDGASIYKLDQGTLGRVLFNKISDIRIAKFFIDCGARGYYEGMYSRMYNELYDDYGYLSGGLALAYYGKSYNVFKLLAENGFSRTSMCFSGHGMDLLKVINQRDDVEALKVLLENGFSRNEIEWTISRNSSSKCGKFLYDNPVIHRKSAALDPLLSKSIPYPSLNTPKFLHKKENKIKIDDYEDRVKAQKSFLNSIGTEERNKLQR